jgi:hypothetical protein
MQKIFFLLLCGFMAHIHAQTSASSTFSVIDQDELIRQCLVFQPLEAKAPQDILVEVTEYRILNQGIDLKTPLNLKVNAKRILFLTKAEINLSESYFLFHTISVVNNKGYVKYYFVYTDKGVKNTIPISIDFEKSNAGWKIVNYSI